MGRKKKVDQSTQEQVVESVNPKLTWEQYWEWRTTICELDLAKKELEVANNQIALSKKDLEIQALKTQVFNLSTLKAKEAAVKDAEIEYANTKNRLEGLLNTSLNGKVIDTVTLEVKEPLIEERKA